MSTRSGVPAVREGARCVALGHPRRSRCRGAGLRRVGLRSVQMLLCGTLFGLGCASPPPPSVTLLFVGDIMLGRYVEATMLAHDDWTLPFRPLLSRLRAADLTFGNLECVTAGADVGTPRVDLAFRADPRGVAGLADAGFDVVSVANNHAVDFGPDALSEMLTHLDRHGIAPVGILNSDRQTPFVREVRGVRLGYLAFSYTDGGTVAARDPVRIAKITGKDLVGSIVAARDEVDYLIVSLHLGRQFQSTPTAAQRGIARGAIEAGADLVIGHHSHVPQEVEKYRHGFIAYSLGDFVFDHPDASIDGVLLEITLEQAQPRRILYARTRINDSYQPELIGETLWEGADLEGADGALD